jgi:ribose transport system permease protein
MIAPLGAVAATAPPTGTSASLTIALAETALLDELLSLVAAADTISGERERGTLEGLLLTPVSRLEIAVGKLLGAFSLWLAALVITVPYVWFLGRGISIVGDALAAGIVVGTLACFVAGLFKGFESAAPVALALAAIFFALALLIKPMVVAVALPIGLALLLRPVPGGDVDADLADLLTSQLAGGVPASLVLLALIVLLIWLPFRRSAIGRAVYAVGSSEVAAFMSGVPIGKAKLLAYALSGLLAAIAGLMLTFITYSGEASSAIGGTYTLNSIAAVVIGGTSLFGGSGSAVGSIFGAFVLRTIGDLLFVFDLEPFWQPLVQGVILLAAVSLGAFRLLRMRNRLDIFT